jgi:CheY-like chemotaxis protein
MNLILNASEALGTDGGLISIRTSRVTSRVPGTQRECLLLEVSDTGRGITPEVQARIFDPFFTTKFAGRGLGLAVVQSIVRMHNGAIHIQSAPGQGTRFEIVLPCATQAASKEQSAIVPASTERIAPSHGTLLLVEDEEGLRIAVAKMLRKRGFSVIEAADGSVARELFLNAKDEIDVILMDMTIPGMSSHEVIAEARRIRPDVKVILTSACSREASLSADTPDIKDFIRKPYQIRELTQLLQDVLSAGGQ